MSVVARQGDGELEFSRQVSGSVDRLDVAARRRHSVVRTAADQLGLARLAVGQPQLVIGSRLRRKMHGQLVGQGLQLVVDRVAFVGTRRAHHISFHVATGSQRGELHLVDPTNCLFEVGLQHAMQLQPLASSDSQRRIAHLVAQVELGQQLIARELAAWNGGADHEAVKLGLGRRIAGPRLGPTLAVVLLIGAVVLEQLGAGLADVVGAVGHVGGDRAAQVVALGLDRLDRAGLGRLVVGGVGLCGHDVYQIAEHYPA
jgi:hypothetical protein